MNATHERDEPDAAAALSLLQATVPMHRRLVRPGEAVYRAGQSFTSLYLVNSGTYKIIHLVPDGREQLVRVHFKGDWLGFDGIAQGCHGCDAIAMDIGEVWSVRYATLQQACTRQTELLDLLHGAMSREISHDREWLMALSTLGADARVAEFLRHWVEALQRRGLRTDQILLRLTRAEIGSFLGLTLESVSRAFSRLAQEQLVQFETSHREVGIPDSQALCRFVQRSLSRESTAAVS